MDTLLLYPALFALSCGAFHYRRQSRSRLLPARHPRRQRARMFYYFTASFVLFALIASGADAGKGGTGSSLFLLPFLAWFAALCVARKLRFLPTEAEVLAYEAAYGQGEPQPVEPLRFYHSDEPDVARAGRQTPIVPTAHPRGSIAWALQELGVGEHATPEQINAAYLRLIKRVHPDIGGDTGYAADLNDARNLLLKQTA